MNTDNPSDSNSKSTDQNSKSFAAYCIAKYRTLLDFAGTQDDSEKTYEMLESIVIPSINGKSLFIDSTSGEPIASPAFPSFITDDHSPFEYSLSFTTDQVHIRLLFEPMPDLGNESSHVITMDELYRASSQTYLAILDFLHKKSRCQAKVDFEKLSTLFVKTNQHLQTVDQHNPFAIWYAIDLKGTKSLFKIYYNLISFNNQSSKMHPSEAVQNGLRSMSISQSAIDRLLNLMNHLGDRASFVFFSVDLNAPNTTRCKIYVRFYEISLDELEDIASNATHYHKGSIKEFVHHFIPHLDRFSCPATVDRTSTFGPIITFVFDTSNCNGPDSVKFHLPIRHYVLDEMNVANSIETYLKKKNLFMPQAKGSYMKTLNNYKEKNNGLTGCQTYVAFSSSRCNPVKEFTVYLSPQLYSQGGQMFSSLDSPRKPDELSIAEKRHGCVHSAKHSNDAELGEDLAQLMSKLEKCPTKINHSVKFLTKTSINERRSLLKAVEYNIFSFPANYVVCDFLSDSGTGALTTHQYSAMFLNDEAYGRNNGYYCLLDSLRDILERGDHPRLAVNYFTQINVEPEKIINLLSENYRGGFVNAGTYQLTNPNTFIVPQGRCAELLLFSTLRFVVEKQNVAHSTKKEKLYVLSNGLFDTTEAHVKTNGFIPMNLYSPKLKEPFHPKDHLKFNPFKGDIDTTLLTKVIDKYHQSILLVVLTITNNTAAGQPVSLSNIRETGRICRAKGIPLMIDACRFAENAAFIKKYEPNYSQKSIRAIAAEIFSHADIVTMSFKKDGMSNIGGVLLFRDSSLFEKLYSLSSTESIGNLLKERQILYFGNDSYGGLSGREIMCCAIGLQEVLEENYLNDRLSQTAYFGNQLIQNNVPVVLPTGGHAVYIDMKSFLGPLYVEEKFQGLGFCIELLTLFGIRSFDSGAFSYCWDLKSDEERESMLHWVRFAIPRNMYNKEHLDYAIEAIAYFYRRKWLIPNAIIKRGRTMTLRHFTAGFDLVYENSRKEDDESKTDL